MDKPTRRDLVNDQHANTLPRLHTHHFFYYHERRCQYVPVDQDEANPHFINDLKRKMTQLMWPRLVAVRVNVLLHALMPLLNLTPDGTCGVMLDAESTRASQANGY